MRVLFTGASSFTGYWLVRELVAADHEVVAVCRGDGRYEGLRAARVRLVRELCEVRYGCAFGNDDFLALKETSFDVLCHQGAEVGDYRSADFDLHRAAAANLHRLPECLVLTGSAFSRYGLSKGLSAAAARFYADREGSCSRSS
jgi:nucleoside-diphosphate-sugar epimerase